MAHHQPPPSSSLAMTTRNTTAWLEGFMSISGMDRSQMIRYFLHSPYSCHFFNYQCRHLPQPRDTINITPPAYKDGERPFSVLECRHWFDRDLEALNERFPLQEGAGGTRLREITGEQFEEMGIIAQHILYERIGVLARWENVNNHFNPDGSLRQVVLFDGPSLQEQMEDPGFMQTVFDMPSSAPPQASNVPAGGTAPHQQFLPQYRSPYPAEDAGVPFPSPASGPLSAAQVQHHPGHPYAPGPSQPPPHQTGYVGVPPPPAAPNARFDDPGRQYALGPPQNPKFSSSHAGDVSGTLAQPPPQPGHLPYPGMPYRLLPAAPPLPTKKRRGRPPKQSAASLSIDAPVDNSSDANAPPQSTKKRRGRPPKRSAASLSVDASGENSSDGNRAAKRSKTQHEEALEGGSVSNPILVEEIASEGNGTAAAGVEDTEMKDAEEGNENDGDIGEQS